MTTHEGSRLRETKIAFDATVTKVEHRDGRAFAVTAITGGAPTRYECTDVISSMPIGALLRAIDPPPPDDVLAAAKAKEAQDLAAAQALIKSANDAAKAKKQQEAADAEARKKSAANASTSSTTPTAAARW